MVPADVVDLVFSFLELDFASLEQCSVAHPYLADLAERYLYANVTLRPSSSNFQPPDVDSSPQAGFVLYPPQFASRLLDRPYNARHIRRLCIIISMFFPFRDSAEVSPILPQISNLCSITLESTQRGAITWNTLSADFRAAFMETLRLPSLKEVGIHGIQTFPLSMFNDCRSVGKVSLQEIGRLESEPYAPHPQLEVLQLHGGSGSLKEIVHWVTGRNLCSLDFGWLDADHRFTLLAQLLQACSKTLTTLTLDIGARCKSFLLVCDLLGLKRINDSWDNVPQA